MNPRECVWRELRQEFMKTILREKGTIQLIHRIITIWYTNLFFCLKKFFLKKNLQQRQQWTKKWEKREHFGLESGESQKQIWRDRWRRNKGGKVHFASWMDIFHPKNARLKKKELYFEVTSWRTIQALLTLVTERRSSASQMTAAKVMYIIPRLPGCARQAADAVSAYTS